MSKKIKTKSIVKRIMGFNITGILIYTALLIVVMYFTLRTGLTDYFKSELSVKQNTALNMIAEKQKATQSAVEWALDDFNQVHDDIERQPFIIDWICNSAKGKLPVDYLMLLDTEGRDRSVTKKASFPVPANLLTQALHGISVTDYVYINDKLSSVTIEPFFYKAKFIGAVAGMSVIANKELTKSIGTNSDAEFAFFKDNSVAVSTLQNADALVPNDKDTVSALKEGKEATQITMLNGKQYVSRYFPLKTANGSSITNMYIGIPMNHVFTVSKSLLKMLLPISIVLSACLLFVLLFEMYLTVIKPVHRVGSAMKNLSSGSADLSYRLPVKGTDEFAAMSMDINTFIAMLQNLIRELHEAQTSLHEIGASLGTNAQETASSIAQILANIEGVRRQSENQTNSITNTSDVLSKSTETVSSLDNLIGTQTTGISESSASIEEMIGNITSVSNSVKKMSTSFGNLNTTVHTGSDKLDDVNKRVEQIASQSKMLIQANTIIAQISSETNLLAMNAAIEASHAGEAGRGFSVVADEIRKLAENSAKQSKMINSELKTISNSIQAVVVSSSDSKTAFGEIIQSLNSTDSLIREIDSSMAEQETASRQVLNSLSSIKNQSAEVNGKSKELNQDVSKVTGDMQNATQISQIILGSMDEMTTGAQQINEAAQSVNQLAEQTAQNIETMERLLAQFKI